MKEWGLETVLLQRRETFGKHEKSSAEDLGNDARSVLRMAYLYADTNGKITLLSCIRAMDIIRDTAASIMGIDASQVNERHFTAALHHISDPNGGPGVPFTGHPDAHAIPERNIDRKEEVVDRLLSFTWSGLSCWPMVALASFWKTAACSS